MFQFEEVILNDINDLKKWIQQFKSYLKPQTVILLSGDLGAGKTTLIYETCQLLDVPLVSSPTFAFIQKYSLATQSQITHGIQFNEISHVDLYRCESDSDIDSIGFWDLFSKKNQIIFVEWPSKVKVQDWPLDWSYFEIHLEVIKFENNFSRKLKFQKLFF